MKAEAKQGGLCATCTKAKKKEERAAAKQQKDKERRRSKPTSRQVQPDGSIINIPAKHSSGRWKRVYKGPRTRSEEYLSGQNERWLPTYGRRFPEDENSAPVEQGDSE